MTTRDQLISDMVAEGDALDALVAGIADADWARPTPAEGWTIAHQISHLAWTDRAAITAATDENGFQRLIEQGLADPDGYVQKGAEEGVDEPPGELLARWRAGRTALRDALTALPEGARVPWYGPPMSVASMATARIMETWAHGLDVADALAVRRAPTDRLRHVAHLGVRTRDFAFAVRGMPAPAEEFRVELTAPDGQVWTWGPVHANQRVTGPALDFCLLVTQRRNRADLGLVAEGSEADRWLDVAQAFAGPPGSGRPPATADGGSA